MDESAFVIRGTENIFVSIQDLGKKLLTSFCEIILAIMFNFQFPRDGCWDLGS